MTRLILVHNKTRESNIPCTVILAAIVVILAILLSSCSTADSRGYDTSTPEPAICTTAKTANLRAGPSTNAEIIRTLHGPQELTVIEAHPGESDWIKVSYDDSEAWIHAGVCEIGGRK